MSIIISDAPGAVENCDVKTFDTAAPDGPAEGVQIRFAAGLPGFPGPRRFRIEDLGPTLRPFSRMRDIDQSDIAFTVVSPGLLFPDYSVEISTEDQEVLGVESPEDVVIMVMITVPRAPQPPTANLLGPIVVNRHTGVAAQIVQHRSSYPVAEPLPAGRE